MPEHALVPSDARTERAIVGGILLEGVPAFFKAQAEQLQPIDFWDKRLQLIYEACWRLAERNEAITLPTVAYLLDRAGTLEDAGSEIYLQELINSTFTAVGIESHARIVIRDAKMRRMIPALQQAVQAVMNGHQPDEIPALTEGLLRDALGDRASTRGLRLADAAVASNRGTESRASTGIACLDRVTGGVGLGELVVVGAYSSHGKTALCARIAANIALAGTPVAYVPIEGDAYDLQHRMAAGLAGISLRQVEFQRGWDTPTQHDEYQYHLAEVQDAPIWTTRPDATPNTPEAVASYVTVMARQHGVKVAFVDHLEVMDFAERQGESTARAYERGLRLLQQTAHREQVALVVQSQITASVAHRPTVPEKPMLRNSAAKEQLSQMILLVGLKRGKGEEGRDITLVEKVKEDGTRDGVQGILMYVTLAKTKNGLERLLSSPKEPRLYISAKSGAVEEL